MTDVVDASALLTFLQDEQGADLVQEILSGGSECSAVNWSEVAQKVRSAGERRDATVWTADRAWGESDRVRQIR